MMYVYMQRESNPDLFAVGFFGPADRWIAESVHATRHDAAARVHFLNGLPSKQGRASELLRRVRHTLALVRRSNEVGT